MTEHHEPLARSEKSRRGNGFLDLVNGQLHCKKGLIKKTTIT